MTYFYQNRRQVQKLMLMLCWLWLIPAGCQAQEALVQRCSTGMNELADQQLFTGTVLVAREGIILYEQAFGMAEREKNIANTLDTKYNICSMGKMLTAAAVMKLVQEGSIKLTDPVDLYVPALNREIAGRIQIRHLLSHTSGLGNYMGHPRFQSLNQRPHTIADKLQLIREEKLAFSPGERFSYSNSGFIVLGAVIEKVSGQSYEACIRDLLLKPLGMQDTEFHPAHFALPTIKNNGNQVRKGPFIPRPSADGGIAMTVHDMLKFDTALHNHRILDAEHTALLFTPNLNDYGFGFMTWSGGRGPGGKTAVGHTGGIPGNSTRLAHVLEDGTAIIVFSNLDRAAAMASRKLEEAIYPAPQ